MTISWNLTKKPTRYIDRYVYFLGTAQYIKHKVLRLRTNYYMYIDKYRKIEMVSHNESAPYKCVQIKREF